MEMEIDGSNSEDEDIFSPTRRETDKKLFGKTFGTDNKKKTNVLKRPRKPRANIRRPNTVKMTRLHGTDIACTDDIKIGQGATSIVYKGYYGEIPCAVKRVDSEYVDVYENELAIWQHMKDKTEDGNVNIVSLFKWHPWKEGGGGTTYYFAMELAICDLAKRVKELKQWRDAKDPQFVVQEKKLPGFLHGAVKGLMWIHNKRILHRDIKPENVLIFETSNGEIAKLGDFGISRKLSETSTGTNSVGRGTSDWMAPEALQAMNNEETFFSTRNIDIFSLGMTSHYAISLGSHPFKYKSRFGIFIMTNIMQKSVQPTNLSYPHLEADHLFQWMMQKEENKRPKILVVSHHPFFWSWEQKKDFLLKVAMCFDSKKDATLLQIRKEVDRNYKMITTSLTNVQSNWLKRLGSTLESLLSQRQHSKGTKNYDGDSIMMLVELFRDKYMHCTDMVDELTTSDLYFGENGSFCEKKYVNYFLDTFPELVIILFCALADRRKELVVLKNKYYSHFNTVPPILPVNDHDTLYNHLMAYEFDVENLVLNLPLKL